MQTAYDINLTSEPMYRTIFDFVLTRLQIIINEIYFPDRIHVLSRVFRKCTNGYFALPGREPFQKYPAAHFWWR